MLKKILKVVAVLVLLVVLGGGGFVFSKTSAFDSEAAKVWSTPLADVKAPDLKAAHAAITAGTVPAEPAPVATPPEGGAAGEADPAAVAKAAADAELLKSVAVYKRGKHLAESIGACNDCHGENFATPRIIDMGPVGNIVGPNITMGGLLKDYSDAEFHRLLTAGVKRDGTSVLFMPAADFRWWPDDDIMALLGFLRVQPPVELVTAKSTVGPLGKILDRTDKLPLMIAPRLAAQPRHVASAPAPTAEYGKHLGGLCQGCHGMTLSGGPIPGAPPELPIPKNITMHESGIAHYDFAKFDTLMRTGVKADGKPLDPFMPVTTLKNMSDVEMKALWEYILTVEKKPFGGR